MSEIRYMISDAARQAGVEAHVLRSWEEELDIKVGRTELGHRYYTDKTIYIMKKVKELRDKGFQLKAIKVLIPEIQKKSEEIEEITVTKNEEKNAESTKNTENIKNAGMKGTAAETAKTEDTDRMVSGEDLKDSTQEVPKPQTILPFVDSLDNLEKFQDIVGDIMKRALQENNVELENRIADSVLKEMEILMKIQEKREEERYRNLDETIRSFQHNRQMVAATKERDRHKKWFRIFR